MKLKKHGLKISCWVVAIALALIQALAYRYSLSSEDSVAYLDIGDAYFAGNWDEAINGLWSPLYSWLLGLAMVTVKPDIYWEFFTVKIVNLAIYIATLFCFDFFWEQLICYYQQTVEPNSMKIPRWIWLILGYLLFLWTSLNWMPLYADTPDLCTAAFVYLATGILLRAYMGRASWLGFAIMGASLGLGYLSKSVMFPVALIYFGISFFTFKKLGQALPKVLVSFLFFAIVSAPFLGALSLSKGHFSFGDAGKFNYAIHVNKGILGRYWHDELPGWGAPQNPPRKIYDNPETFEFASPIGGTYPLWHDPSYWYEGLHFKFSPIKQVQIIVKNTIIYYREFLAVLISGYVIFLAVGGKVWYSLKKLASNWILLIPAAAGLGAYAVGTDMVNSGAGPLQPSMRYVAPFVVLLFAGVFSCVRLPNSQESKRWIAGLTLAILLFVGVQLSAEGLVELRRVSNPGPHIHYKVTRELQRLGLKSQDPVAVLGIYINGRHYWARLLRAKIISEVVDSELYWNSNSSVRADVLAVVARTGAKLIVDRPDTPLYTATAIEDGWQELNNTGYYIYFLGNDIRIHI